MPQINHDREQSTDESKICVRPVTALFHHPHDVKCHAQILVIPVLLTSMKRGENMTQRRFQKEWTNMVLGFAKVGYNEFSKFAVFKQPSDFSFQDEIVFES